MSALTFDTLKFARRLKEAGMDARLAEEQAEALATQADMLATRNDLFLLRKDLEHEIKLLEQRLIIKLGAMMVVAVGAVATLAKIL